MVVFETVEELPDINKLNIQESEESQESEENEGEEREDLVNKLLEEYSFEELVDLLSQLEDNDLYRGGVEPFDENEAAEELASTLIEIKDEDRLAELEEVAPELSELLSEETSESSPVSESRSPVAQTRTYTQAPAYTPASQAPAYTPAQTRTYTPASQAPAYTPAQTSTYTPAAQTRTYSPAQTSTYTPAAQTSYKPQSPHGAVSQQYNPAVNYLAGLGIDQVRYLLRQLSNAYGVPYKPGRSKLTAAEAIVNAISGMPAENVEAISPQLAEAYNML